MRRIEGELSGKRRKKGRILTKMAENQKLLNFKSPVLTKGKIGSLAVRFLTCVGGKGLDNAKPLSRTNNPSLPFNREIAPSIHTETVTVGRCCRPKDVM
jgi:hypothetical protein